MDNSEKYHFADFTLENYRKYVRLAKKRFVFRNYDNFNKDENFILWRHDVDYSMHAALRLAKIEREEEVQSTFFLHLHNEFYNLFEYEITQIVNEVLGMGHSIGLHFDLGYYRKRKELNNNLKFEKEILQTLFARKITVFSLHNPGKMKTELPDETYAEMINTGSAYFKSKVPYCSDSFGIWRFRRLEDVLTDANYKCLQILTHPEWWTELVTSPKERVWTCIDGRAEKNRNNYENILRNYELRVIDW